MVKHKHLYDENNLFLSVIKPGENDMSEILLKISAELGKKTIEEKNLGHLEVALAIEQVRNAIAQKG